MSRFTHSPQIFLYFCSCIYPHNLQGSRCRHLILNTRVSNISKHRNATTSPTQGIPEWLYRSAMHVLSFNNTSRIHFKLFRFSAFIIQVNLNSTWTDPSTPKLQQLIKRAIYCSWRYSTYTIEEVNELKNQTSNDIVYFPSMLRSIWIGKLNIIWYHVYAQQIEVLYELKTRTSSNMLYLRDMF